MRKNNSPEQSRVNTPTQGNPSPEKFDQMLTVEQTAELAPGQSVQVNTDKYEIKVKLVSVE